VRLDSSAPTRIDLAGGTIDIWPLYLFHPGAQTINAAISLRAHCTLISRSDRKVTVRSEDSGSSVQVDHWANLPVTGELALLGHLLRFYRAEGVDLVTRAESPVGAGIAGSSALAIAVCGALDRWTTGHRTPDELLGVAMNCEAQALQVPTGVQDYRPALYGGIAAIELGVDGVRRRALDVDPDALGSRLVVAYTGASRNSGINNWEVTRRHIEGDSNVFDVFERIRDIAAAMRDALGRGRWQEVARLVADEWEHRKRLAPGVTTPAIEALMARAREAGALAAKVCGAGGGGCLFCLAEPGRVPAVRSALERAGATILDCTIEREGLSIEQSSIPAIESRMAD
jgi:D-glycero-alpha-D-manno-heptose-7-phosphate kinase